jgi:toxin ParE1/3/4
MKLTLLPQFHSQLRQEYIYIRERNPQAAKKVRKCILESVRRLGDYPMSGRAWRLKKSFELVIPGLSYIVIYDIVGDKVRVLALFHTSRNLPPHGIK